MSDQITLPEKLDHAAAERIYDALKDAQGGPVAVDGAKVRTLGGQCAQVLLAAVRRWDSDGQEITITASDDMRSDLSRLGVQDDILREETVV